MEPKDRATEENMEEDMDEDIRAKDEDMQDIMVEAEDVDHPTNLGEGGAEAKEESNQDSARLEEVIASHMGIVPTQVHNAPLQVPTTR